MEIVLVHWLIKKGREIDFENHWKKMSIEEDNGLYREILTTPDKNTFDPKFQTFTLENPNYTTYINVGIWKSLTDFDNAIEKYFPKASTEKKDGKTIHTIEVEDFEFKLRERIVLRKVSDRGVSLPEADSIQ
ncbi:hypothetical protein [Sediminibacterium salmoneum]|uniref:hypothetical protein n=1 Tax=Sediminibacterium salmoneum TaxID=426421 RepID=UPI00047CB197|nr:hypothetical protein [Sediminibacterium salmoneum]